MKKGVRKGVKNGVKSAETMAAAVAVSLPDLFLRLQDPLGRHLMTATAIKQAILPIPPESRGVSAHVPIGQAAAFSSSVSTCIHMVPSFLCFSITNTRNGAASITG